MKLPKWLWNPRPCEVFGQSKDFTAEHANDLLQLAKSYHRVNDGDVIDERFYYEVRRGLIVKQIVESSDGTKYIIVG